MKNTTITNTRVSYSNGEPMHIGHILDRVMTNGEKTQFAISLIEGTLGGLRLTCEANNEAAMRNVETVSVDSVVVQQINSRKAGE